MATRKKTSTAASSSAPKNGSRRPSGKRSTSKRYQGDATSPKERKVIFGVAAMVLGLMVILHLSGCLNNLKANKLETAYVYSDVFGVNMPTLFPIHGIDVSVHQGNINWKKVKDVNSGEIKIDFAFIKASEGRTKVDRYFKNNWRETKKHQIIRGAYHFFLPNKSGKDQAELFLKTVSFEDGDLRPVLDIEITGGADAETMYYNLKEWLNTVEKAVGKKPIIYSSLRFYEQYLHDEFSHYPLWIAHYHVPSLNMNAGNRWNFWQHTDKAKIAGTPKKIDLNVFNGSFDDLDKLRL